MMANLKPSIPKSLKSWPKASKKPPTGYYSTSSLGPGITRTIHVYIFSQSVHIHIYVYICVCTEIRTYMYIYICIIYTHMYSDRCISICTYNYVCVYTYIHFCIQVHVHVHNFPKSSKPPRSLRGRPAAPAARCSRRSLWRACKRLAQELVRVPGA